MDSPLRRSKKQSDTKTPIPKLLEDHTLFIDRCLGSGHVPEVLRAQGINVEKHKDHFRDDEEDSVWLRECGRRGWVVLTKDKNIRHNPLEKAAILESGVAAFVITSKDLNGEQTAVAFVQALRRIGNLLASKRRPFIARVHRDGEVEIWINYRGEFVLKD